MIHSNLLLTQTQNQYFIQICFFLQCLADKYLTNRQLANRYLWKGGKKKEWSSSQGVKINDMKCRSCLPTGLLDR